VDPVDPDSFPEHCFLHEIFIQHEKQKGERICQAVCDLWSNLLLENVRIMTSIIQFRGTGGGQAQRKHIVKGSTVSTDTMKTDGI
jgi:hypothetical protein